MIICLIIILAILTRFIPHMANVSVITPLAMFSAVYLSKKQAIAIPLVVRFVSDIFLGFFSWPLMVAVYASHLFGVALGLWIKRSQNEAATKWLKIFASGLASAAVFFLVTNFAFFYGSYSHDWAGIMQSYANGLPFLRGTLIGDVGYAVALFGAYDVVKYFARRHMSPAKLKDSVQNYDRV
jgi:hypothetical protein